MKNNVKSNKLIILGIVLLLISIVMTYSCTQETTKTTPTPTATPAVSKYGGTLKIGLLADITGFGQPYGKNLQDVRVTGVCEEPLFRYNSVDRSGPLEPLLATGFKLYDKQTIEIYLRKGVKFHDGSDFNASVVKYNIEHYVKHPRKNATAWDFIDKIDIIDDYTVRVHTSKPDLTVVSDVPFLFASNQAQMKSVKAFEQGEAYAGINGVGTGPFKFVSWDKGQKLVFEKFDGYWQKDKPYLDKIEFTVIADALTASAAFQRGEVDMILGLAQNEPKIASDLEKLNKYVVNMYPNRVYGLAGDAQNADSPYADLRVRQALSYAVDSKALCDALGFGYLKPSNEPASYLTGTYNKNVIGYPYNPQKAKELLAAAGYPNGFKTKIISSTVGNFPQVSTAYQNFFSKVGITAEIELCAQGALDTYSYNGWKNGLFPGGAGVDNPFQIQTFRSNFYSSGPPQISRLRNAELDKIIDDASAAPDMKTATATTQKFIEVFVDKYCVVNIYYESYDAMLKYPKIKDDNMYVLTNWWTPENAWIQK